MTKPKPRSKKAGAEFVLTIPSPTLETMKQFATHRSTSVEQLVVSQLSGFNSAEEGTITCEFKK